MVDYMCQRIDVSERPPCSMLHWTTAVLLELATLCVPRKTSLPLTVMREPKKSCVSPALRTEARHVGETPTPVDEARKVVFPVQRRIAGTNQRGAGLVAHPGFETLLEKSAP
jgi:hypothetical protein